MKNWHFPSWIIWLIKHVEQDRLHILLFFCSVWKYFDTSASIGVCVLIGLFAITLQTQSLIPGGLTLQALTMH